jgi:RHS repeat-associated protein
MAGDTAFGIGWSFTLGAIKRNIYIAPDGSQHIFSAFGTSPGYYKTTDATSFYLHDMGTNGWEMWDGDGNHYVFGHTVTGYDDLWNDFRHDYGRGRDGWYLTQLTDPFGNGLSATYPMNGTISSPCWVNPYYPPPDPGYPETPSMQMKCNLNGAHWVPQTISLTSGATISIGRKSTGVGSEAGLIGSFTFDMPVGGIATTRTWSLDYDATWVPSACPQGGIYNTYRLTKVWLPSDLASSPRFQFDYTTCPFPLMSRMTLPTGGTVDYVWGGYNFYHGRWIGACHPQFIPGNSPVKVSSGPISCGAEPIPNFPYPGFDCSGGSSWLDSGTAGVIARTETDPISGLAGTTTYTQYAFPFGEHDTNQTATYNSQSLTVVVFPPDANGKQRSKSILFYAGSTGETTYPGDRTGGDIREADYDFAVQAYAQPISQPVCNGGTDRDFCPNHAVRVTQRTFEYDTSDRLTNRHLQSETKIYGATNGLGQCTTCFYHSVTYSNSYGRNWDAFTNDSSGNGRHYNVETHSGNLGGDSRQVVTTWSPVVSPWFPNLFDKRITSDATGSLNQYFDYDHGAQANGFLRGSVTWDSGRSLLFADCLYTKTSQGAVDTHGNVASRYTGTFSGWTSEPDPHSCSLYRTDPASWGGFPGNGDIFATDFTYQNGQRVSARAVNGSSPGGWLKYNVTRDLKTGWITSSRDTSGLQTSYLYDSLGRPTSITPPGEVATTVTYDSTTQTTAIRSGGADSTTWSRFQYDGFGRTIRERRQMPGGTYAKRFTKFDGRGYAYFQSEWVADSLAETLYANAGTNCSFSGSSYSTYVPSSAPGIYRACFDPYGRPQLSTGAGYSSQVTISRTDARQPTFAYYSDTTEASTIACVNGTLASTTPHCSGGSDATTTTMKDAFGRSTSVNEPNGFTTSYGYDVNGKLSSVAQGAQSRSFSYDKFGFLRTETTPEKGTVTYDSIGSLGNVRQQRESGGLVSHSFDYAGRLTGVSSDEPRTYLTNTYDEATDGTVSRGSSLGKLTTSMASNYYPSTGFTTAFFPGGKVTDSLYYSGVGGRLSQKKTTLSNGSASTVEGWTYNSLGLVATESYPRIDSTGVFSVTTSYTAGLPTGVSANGQSVVTSATYNPAGALASYTAGNGITTTTVLDPNGMPRPRQISTSDGQFDTGYYSYDGAGNIRSMGPDTFAYDANFRLLSATYPSTSTTQTYGYDVWGNLVQKAGTPIGVNPATNRLTGATYDVRGNVTVLEGETYSYDALNRQTKHDAPTSHWSYLLDGANERIVKAIPPGGLVARREAARIILQAMGQKPLTVCKGYFSQDVPCSDPERGWIEKFYELGITAGCVAPQNGTNGKFCANGTLTRWQMAVFISLAKVLPGTVPASGNVAGVGSYNCMTGGASLFGDVLPTDAGCRFIHYLYANSITAGCSVNPRLFCPNDTTPHWQMEAFASLAWNGFGYVPPGATYTFRGAGSSVLTEYQDSTVSKDYVYLGTRLVGTNESAGWKYHVTDHLGSVRLTTNAVGAVLEHRKYWPWGEEAGTVGAGRMAFAGMELDLESTRPRYYDHARNLETGNGRFLSPDLLSGKPQDPQSWNRYTYARNNPLKYVDPDGRNPLAAALAWVGGGASTVGLAPAILFVGSAFIAADIMRPNSIILNSIAESIVGVHNEKTGGDDAGVYEFPDAKEPGKVYVGQSGDVPRRIDEHEDSGKKEAGSPATVRPMPGSAKGEREKAEQERINELGGKKTVPGSETSNKVNPIGPRRQKTIEDTYGPIYPPTN